MGNVLSCRIFSNVCCKSLKFSMKENQEKSCRLMIKVRQKQTTVLLHLFLHYGFFSNLYVHFYCWYLFPVLDSSLANVPILYSSKTPKNHMLSSAPKWHKLEHHQPNRSTLIDDQYPHFTPTGNTRKPKRPSDIFRGTQNQKICRKRVKWQDKINQPYCKQKIKSNKIK